jgi:predicted MFS family arabinose efflux permease
LLVILPVTLVVPVLKTFVQDRFQVGVRATTLFMSVNMVGAVLAAPLAGAISDRLGRRRPLILWALVLDAALLALLPLAPSYGVLLGLRAVEGMAHIFALSLVLAMAADVARERGSGRIMGAVGATLTLGVALGAPLGGRLGNLDGRLPLWVGGGLSLIAALWCLWFLRDTRQLRRSPSLGKALALVFGNRLLAVPLVFALVDRFTVGFFITAFPLYVQNVLGRTPAATGMLLSFFLLPFALLCYPMGRLADRGSRTLLIGGGSILYGACVVLVGEVGEDLLPVLMVALGVTSSVMFVPTLMLTGELAGPEHKATAMGGFNTAGSLGFLVGAIVAGEIIERVSASPAAADGYTAAFWCAGFAEIACVLLTLPALLRIDRQRRE